MLKKLFQIFNDYLYKSAKDARRKSYLHICSRLSKNLDQVMWDGNLIIEDGKRQAYRVRKPEEVTINYDSTSSQRRSDNDDFLNPLNPLSPISPFNPIGMSFYSSSSDYSSPSSSSDDCHRSSYNSSDDSSSTYGCGSSSYDSGSSPCDSSSSYDSGSSYSSDSGSYSGGGSDF